MEWHIKQLIRILVEVLWGDIYVCKVHYWSEGCSSSVFLFLTSNCSIFTWTLQVILTCCINKLFLCKSLTYCTVFKYLLCLNIYKDSVLVSLMPCYVWLLCSLLLYWSFLPVSVSVYCPLFISAPSLHMMCLFYFSSPGLLRRFIAFSVLTLQWGNGIWLAMYLKSRLFVQRKECESWTKAEKVFQEQALVKVNSKQINKILMLSSGCVCKH